MTILPSVTLHINRAPFFHFHFSLENFYPHILSAYIHLILHLLHTFLRIFHHIHINPTQKWPDPMKLSQLHRNPLHPRNTSRNLGKLDMNVLESLGKTMNTMKNIMNVFKLLSRHWGRMNKSRTSLDILGEWQNSQRDLRMNKQGKPKGKERRRFSSLKSDKRGCHPRGGG